LKAKFTTITAIVIAALAAFGVTAAAAYDSSEDPIVSLSYLTKIFKTDLLEELNETIEDEIARRMDNLDLSQYQPSYQEPAPAVSSTYEVVELSWGDALYAAGACDIMLRSGSAYCIAPDASQGIADYTAGSDPDDYLPEDFFSETPDPDYPLVEGCTLIVGHAPTKSGRIERGEGTIYLHCGVEAGGALACLRLEDQREFYV